jgi:dolichyl-phosphate-mannose-protein mannosyltransferase
VTTGAAQAEAPAGSIDGDRTRPDVPAQGRSPRRDRLHRPMPADGIWGWLVPAIIALVAGILRFDRLGVPADHVFDEVYYAQDAADLLAFGVEYDVEEDQPQFIVHPPAGKWLIAVGQAIFGNDSFGWRFSVALVGTLAVFLMARISRRLFRSLVLGATAGILLAVDGLHYVLSRTALLDGILMFWVLAAFGCLLVDRDRVRERLAARWSRGDGLAEGGAGGWRRTAVHDHGKGVGRFGPGFGVRPWRLAAGLCLGLACATKWNAVWFVAVFGLMTVLWDVGARRLVGVRRPFLAALARDAAPALLSIVLVAVVVYIASWTGWMLAGERAYDRYAAAGSGPGIVPEALRSLWHYHEAQLGFHRGLDSFHSYRSHPWSWIVLSRPVSFHYTGLDQGDMGCAVESCSRAILGIGTPVLWWGGVIALAVMVVVWLGRRDWRAGAVLSGLAAGWLPWFAFADRTQYYFYAVAFLPWTILAVTMCLGYVLGPPAESTARRAWGAGVAGTFVVLVVLNFAYLLPILSDQTIPYAEWYQRMWLPSWI